MPNPAFHIQRSLKNFLDSPVRRRTDAPIKINPLIPLIIIYKKGD